ncbi:MAG: polymer-forming cytoskeletal protein [Thermoanaerobaculia bacterium]
MLPCAPDRFPKVSAVIAILFLALALPLTAQDRATRPGAEAPAAELLSRYRVVADDDGIELTPIERDSAVETIRLEDGENEALVNGKSFSAGELRAFLGDDGDRLARLLTLSDEARRHELGVGEEDEEETWVTPRADEDQGGERGSANWVPRPPRPPRAPHAPRIYIENHGDDRVSFGESIHIGPGESAGQAVCIGCSVTVEGELHDGAVAVGGRVEVRPGGVVSNDAVAIGGRVLVESGGTVEGDAVSVGAAVRVEDGGTVEGQRSSVGWGSGIIGSGRHGFLPFDFDGTFGEFFWSFLRALMLALVAAAVLLFLRGSVDRSARRLVDEPWKTVFAGLLTQLLFFPVLIVVTVILAVSVIGIPLLVLVPVAMLAFVIAMLVGYVAVARSIGRWARDRFGWNMSEPFVTVLVGVLILQGATLAGRLVSIPGGFLGLVGFALVCLGFFVKYMAWTMGLGAMVLSVMARDWRRPAPPAAPAPEPTAPTEGAPRSWQERIAELQDDPVDEEIIEATIAGDEAAGDAPVDPEPGEDGPR